MAFQPCGGWGGELWGKLCRYGNDDRSSPNQLSGSRPVHATVSAKSV